MLIVLNIFEINFVKFISLDINKKLFLICLFLKFINYNLLIYLWHFSQRMVSKFKTMIEITERLMF